MENLTALQEPERVLDTGDPDELERAQQREDARHRAALRAIRKSIARIRAAGAPLPPNLPVVAVQKRAAELGVDLPDLED